MGIRSRYPLTYRYWQRESHPVRVLVRAVAVLATLFALGAGWLIYHDLTLALPSVEQLARYLTPSTTRVYADDGKLIGEFYLEKRYPLAFDSIPLRVQRAFLAAEDADFYLHPGVNPLGMARAAFANWRAGRKLQGGSTITQQVVKYLLLTPEKSYRRKIQEIILSLRLERHLSKREIFELYLNQIYLGSGAYGIEAAAREYFGKPVADLSLAETAMIAGLSPAPSRYSPFKNWHRAKARQRYVLERMMDERYISYEELIEAWQALTPLATPAARQEATSAAPYYVAQVRQLLQQRYGGQATQQLGFKVYGTVNLELQRAAEQAVRAGIDALCERQHCGRNGTPRPEGALIAINLLSGQVKALVGGEDFQHSQFNRATQAKRQPGSAFKPFIYAAALARGFTPASVIDDAPVSFPDNGRVWSPQNYERRYFGRTRLREALTFSRNVVTVKIASELGLDYVTSYMRKFGLHAPKLRHLSMALGSSELTLAELTLAYGVFASGGHYFEPLYMTQIADSYGHEIQDFTRTEPSPPVLSPEHAYLMTSMMQDVIERGTGKAAHALGRPAAGKTGTSNDFHDAWFIGYTPELLVGVWVGYDEKRSLGEKETGGRAAAPIWLAFMRQALGEAPVRDFELPEGIVFAPIDPRTGERAPSGSSSFLLECFRRGTEPLRRTELAAVSPEEQSEASASASVAALAAAEGF
ncbi:MAG: PBP1A family penicillin-binding protein [Deltaproteobacteria bacterium]|nr:PBP1A family penicillin-binding protein [Deltaproteobacteria bacterium]